MTTAAVVPPALKLYGVPLSQPVRSVAWTLLQLGVPFDWELAVPGMANKVGTKNEAFRLLTPWHTTNVPVLQYVNHETSGLVLSESSAILVHLCERYATGAAGSGGADGGSHSMYAPPASDEKAVMDAYLHWHHGNTRFLAKIFQTKVRPDLTKELSEQDLERIQQILTNLDEGWLGMGSSAGGGATPLSSGGSPVFIGGSKTASIADILAYGELSTVTMTNLLSLDDYSNLSSWMSHMTTLPYHNEAHVALTSLGDLTDDTITTPLAKRLGVATKAGLKAFAEVQQQDGFKKK